MIDMLENIIPNFNPGKVQQQQGCCDNHGPPQQAQQPVMPQQEAQPWPTNFPKPIIGIEKNGIITSGGLEIVDGALNAVKMIRQKLYKLVLISDERGRQQSQVDAEMASLMNIFGNHGIQSIDSAYYSVNADKADHFVKPSTGMFKRAASEVAGADWKKGWYVGRTINDLKAADKVGAKPILIRNPETLEKLNTFSNKDLKKKTRVYNSLLEFASDLK